MTLLGAGFAALIGLALGLLGGGGSILTVPVFVYLLGFGVKEAVALSLLVVGAASLVGVVGHWRAGHVDVRVGAFFGSVAMVGTYLGARLAVFVSGEVQLGLFALFMLVAAVFMFRGSRPPPDAVAGAVDPLPIARMPLGLIALEGLAVGVVTGLVGVGGGFLIVPALVVLGKVGMKQAVGTSLLVIAMKSGAGFVGYIGQIDVPWDFVLPFTALAVAGILVGSRMARQVPQVALRHGFAVFLVLMGGFVLYQNRGVVTAALEAPVRAQTVDPSNAGDAR
jgi:hypothetical protein